MRICAELLEPKQMVVHRAVECVGHEAAEYLLGATRSILAAGNQIINYLFVFLSFFMNIHSKTWIFYPVNSKGLGMIDLPPCIPESSFVSLKKSKIVDCECNNIQVVRLSKGVLASGHPAAFSSDWSSQPFRMRIKSTIILKLQCSIHWFIEFWFFFQLSQHKTWIIN